MKWFFKRKDGGQDSYVTGYWLVEAKKGISVCLLRFDENTRENFHSHAFNCFSWVLTGGLFEQFHTPGAWARVKYHLPSFKPFITRKTDLHRVKSIPGKGTSWVLSFRGPWDNTWYEVDTQNNVVNLTHGRHVVGTKAATK